MFILLLNYTQVWWAVMLLLKTYCYYVALRCTISNIQDCYYTTLCTPRFQTYWIHFPTFWINDCKGMLVHDISFRRKKWCDESLRKSCSCTPAMTNLGPVSWRSTTVKWRQFSPSNRHSSIGTRQTEYHEALPLSANDEVRCDYTFTDIR